MENLLQYIQDFLRSPLSNCLFLVLGFALSFYYTRSRFHYLPPTRVHVEDGGNGCGSGGEYQNMVFSDDDERSDHGVPVAVVYNRRPPAAQPWQQPPPPPTPQPQQSPPPQSEPQPQNQNQTQSLQPLQVFQPQFQQKSTCVVDLISFPRFSSFKVKFKWWKKFNIAMISKSKIMEWIRNQPTEASTSKIKEEDKDSIFLQEKKKIIAELLSASSQDEFEERLKAMRSGQDPYALELSDESTSQPINEDDFYY